MGKTGGLLAFAAGIAAGVAAAIFSDENNRAAAEKKFHAVKKEAVKISKEVEKNPRAYAEKLAKKAEAKVRQVANTESRKVVKKTAKKR